MKTKLQHLLILSFVPIAIGVFNPSSVINSQNLVPNPSFEQYDTCPNNLSQFDYVIDWSTYRINPDYFNSCSSDIHSTIPNNFFGFQQPMNGNAYVGLYCRAAGFTDCREYIGCELINNLVAGNKYYMSVKVSAANANQCYTNNIGILFSMHFYSSTDPAPITNYSHMHSIDIITDTLNWILITGSFVADSNYQYIIIGNFYDDISTDTLMTGLNSSSYYYIDGVCVSTDSLTCNMPNSIDEIKLDADDISISPNPANTKVYIKNRIIDNKPLYCNIYNYYGHFLQKQYITSEIDVSNLPNGIYLFQIEFDDKIINKKIVINH